MLGTNSLMYHHATQTILFIKSFCLTTVPLLLKQQLRVQEGYNDILLFLRWEMI